MTIELAIANIQTKMLALSGMKAAPNVPPEGTAVFPFAVCYERSGEMILHSAGFAQDLAVIWAEIHVGRGLLGPAITQAMAFRDPFQVALMNDPTLGGTVSNFTTVRRTFGLLSWGGVETIGYRWEIGLKMQIT
jgi:F0F1-type ATP synthase membrane subunit c/vacuolar-type H+-ATPase subunit K